MQDETTKNIERIGSAKKPFFHIGQSADVTLEIIRRDKMLVRGPAKQVGKDAMGKIVEWYPGKYTLTLKRQQRGGKTMYRITEINVSEDGS